MLRRFGAQHVAVDGNLLIVNDAFRGVTVNHGKLILPDGLGLGLTST
jgi:hypothetical protein